MSNKRCKSMNVLEEEGQSSINQISWSNTSYHTDGKIYELERIWEKRQKYHHQLHIGQNLTNFTKAIKEKC